MDNYKKKYDEALERAKKLKENPQSVFNEYSPKEGDTICDYIFPELKESEDDKIREQIIYAINKLNVPESEKNKLLAWLEKQGEKKPNDKLAWSEGDEVLLSSVINSLLIFEDIGASKMKIDWLKSIKDKIKKEAV